jgi:phage tail-like protein
MQDVTKLFRNLNRDNLWRGFSWEGLALGADGSLRLFPVPRLEGTLPPDLATFPLRPAPAGLAVDRNGTIYFSDPASSMVFRIDACTGETGPVPCLGGKGSGPLQFEGPTALLIPANRHVLYVADSGNSRVQLVDLDTMQLLNILTGFEMPNSLAEDEAGNLFVADSAAGRVDQFTPWGDRTGSFWESVSQSGWVEGPVAVASDGGHVYILDGQTHGISIFDTAGNPLETFDTSLDGAAVFMVIDGNIHAADPVRGRLATFSRDQHGKYVRTGDAAGYEGPIAALASDGRGGLLVLPGAGIPPLDLRINASYAASGVLWSDAIQLDDQKHFWNRVHAAVALSLGAHIQFFFHSGPPLPAPPPPDSSGAFPSPWRTAGPGITDFFVGGEETQSLFVGALFTNDGHSTPVLSQVRVEFDQESYLPHLPAIYRERTCDDFLLRYLMLFESFFEELESQIDRLPALLDPYAAPAEALPWLAGFVALTLPETWDEERQREAIATAYERYARRGTASGLRDTLRAEAGVRAVIEEPIQDMGCWVLPAASTSCKPGAADWEDTAHSVLGFTTMLVSAEPQGAVAGLTATLGRSQLLAREEYGVPLFDSVAHRFTVLVYPGEVNCPSRAEQLVSIIEREKPAHTIYELCIIRPGLRIGYQARLGIDTLMGGGPVPSRLGEAELVLAGQPRGQLGTLSRVGVNTQL